MESNSQWWLYYHQKIQCWLMKISSQPKSRTKKNTINYFFLNLLQCWKSRLILFLTFFLVLFSAGFFTTSGFPKWNMPCLKLALFSDYFIHVLQFLLKISSLSIRYAFFFTLFDNLKIWVVLILEKNWIFLYKLEKNWIF